MVSAKKENKNYRFQAPLNFPPCSDARSFGLFKRKKYNTGKLRALSARVIRHSVIICFFLYPAACNFNPRFILDYKSKCFSMMRLQLVRYLLITFSHLPPNVTYFTKIQLSVTVVQDYKIYVEMLRDKLI